MPIEIRELVIRAQVAPGDSQTATARTQPPTGGQSQEDLIRICVQEVLRILEERGER
jgi:hypothetical protein